MQDCRLVIFEGLMGSGKSTMAMQTALELQQREIPFRYFWESELPHPVKARPRYDGGTFTAEEQITRSLAKWRTFVAHALQADKVTVFDGQLFHVNVSNIFYQNGTKEQIVAYIIELVEIIQPLKPRLVYFFQKDIKEALLKVCGARGQRWKENHIRSREESLLGKTLGLKGFAGLVRFCEMYRELTDHLFEILELNKLAIENSAGDWDSYSNELFEFLSLGEWDEGLKISNAYLTQNQDPIPARLHIENQTDRSLVVYRLGFKKTFEEYVIQVVPKETRLHNSQFGRRLRIRDVNSGETVKDVIVCQAEQIIKIKEPV